MRSPAAAYGAGRNRCLASICVCMNDIVIVIAMCYVGSSCARLTFAASSVSLLSQPIQRTFLHATLLVPEAAAPAPCICRHCPCPCKPRNKRTTRRSPASGRNSTLGRRQPKRAIAKRTGQAKQACATRCCSRTRAKAWRILPTQAKTGQTECPKREHIKR